MAFDSHHARLKFCIGSKASVWFFAHLIIPPFHLAYNVFSFVLHTKLGLHHSLTLRVIHWICGQPLHLVRTHLFYCSHGAEWIASHDTIQNAFASIVKNARFHVSCEQTHVLPPPSLQFSCRQVDIVLSTNGIHTLVDVVIVDPI